MFKNNPEREKDGSWEETDKRRSHKSPRKLSPPLPRGGEWWNEININPALTQSPPVEKARARERGAALENAIMEATGRHRPPTGSLWTVQRCRVLTVLFVSRHNYCLPDQAKMSHIKSGSGPSSSEACCTIAQSYITKHCVLSGLPSQSLVLYQPLYYSNHIGVAHSPQNILDEQWTPYICTLYL